MKRSIVVDGNGGPLGIVVAGANVPDMKLLAATLDAMVVPPPFPTSEDAHGAPLGCRADPGRALEVPVRSGAIREESRKLPRPGHARLHLDVDPYLASSTTTSSVIEIDSKALCGRR